MARQSDFAQKLLDDLRMRKERMAMSQNSNQSSQLSVSDKYRNFKRPSQGSIEINPSETIGSKTWDKHRRMGSQDMPLAIQKSSKELVPFGRAQTSDNIADLSIALAFALKNGGNLRRMESSNNQSMGCLHHTRRSMDITDINRRQSFDRSLPSNGQFPALSQHQIKEISRGAQKLNQILKTCCNGVNFDKYSIEIGKELLKGAIDLEESLRMLVNLQDASDHMVRPKRRQQIRLIEIEDDDDKVIVEENKQKQLDRPKSFHRHSRSSLEEDREASKNGALEQRHTAITHHTEAFHLDSKQQAPNATKLVSHRRSASCGPATGTVITFRNPNKHSNSALSQTEKVRIPNVIAKLMGLEELPPSTEPKSMAQKEVEQHIKQVSRSGKDSNKTLKVSSKQVELKTMHSEKHAPQTGSRKIMQTNKTSETPDSRLMLYTDEILITQNAPIESVTYEGRPQGKNPKNTEETNLLSSSKILTFKINTTHNSINQMQLNTEILMDRQEKRRIKDPKEQKTMKKPEIMEASLKDDFQRMKPQIHKPPDFVDTKEEKAATQEIALQKERKNVNESLLVSRNQQKSPHNMPSQKSSILQTSVSQGAGARVQAAEVEQQNATNNIRDKKFKGRERILKNTSKPTLSYVNLQKNLSHRNHTVSSKKTSAGTLDAMPPKMYLKVSRQEDHAREENSTSFKLNMKKSRNDNLERQKPSSIDGKTGLENVPAPISTARSTKLVCAPQMHKLDNDQVDKRVNPRAIREKGSPHDMAKAIKKQTSVLQPNQRTHSEIRRSKEAEGASIKVSSLAKDLQKHTRCASILGNCVGDEKKGLENKFHNATLQDITMEVSDSQKASMISLHDDKAPKSSDVVSIQTKGKYECAMAGITKSPKQDEPKIPKTGISGSLTENEYHLKQILIKSQLFLNAAEALFKLLIPVDIFHASANKYQDEENKQVLDCAYEVMKRKGRRQELMYRSHTIGTTKVKCLDDLVKELHKDLEKLKLSTGNRFNEYDVADCLHEMLQKDIENRNPDVNCMWDFGWSDSVSTYLEKEEVVRDVEKFMLNVLIDEAMRDMLPVSIAV